MAEGVWVHLLAWMNVFGLLWDLLMGTYGLKSVKNLEAAHDDPWSLIKDLCCVLKAGPAWGGGWGAEFWYFSFLFSSLNVYGDFLPVFIRTLLAIGVTAREPNVPVLFRPTARTILSLSSLNSSGFFFFFAGMYKVWIMNEDKTVEFNLPRDPSTEALQSRRHQLYPSKGIPRERQ